MSVRINKERLKGFTEDHIQRLAGNNPGGIFTTILTAITNAYNAYYGDLSSELTNLAAREGLTTAMNDARTALEKNISLSEKLIAFTYAGNPTKYAQFYPDGITEYLRADLATFGTITDRFKAALTLNAADFTAPFIAAFTGVHTTFVSNRNAQLTKKGDVEAERSDIATTKPALAKQLTTNLLTIALEYVGDESKAALYFDQSILDAAFREADRKVKSEINPGETQNAFDNVSTPDLRISFKNESEEALVVGFAAAANITPSLLTVQSGNEVILNASELGWTSENKFFNISNGTGVAGKYTVEKL